VVARGGDRLVLRSFSPVSTIGGGRVLDPSPPRRTPWPARLAAASPAERLGALLERRPAGLASGDLPILLGLLPAEARAVASAAPGVRRIGEHWVDEKRLATIEEAALAQLRRWHRTRPADAGLPLETLRRALRAPEVLVEQVVAGLIASGRVRTEYGVARLSGFTPRVEGGDAEVDRLVRIVEEAGLTPPSLAELERQTGRRDVATILRLAARDGRVEAVERERYYARPALDRFSATLVELGRDGLIIPGALRERLGISRKYMIPLLEWADARGITERVGDARKLRNA
jgi:selenocysteine-specific elongation factor